MKELEEKASDLIQQYLDLSINFPYIDTQDGNCIGSGYMTHNSAVKCAIQSVNHAIETLEKKLKILKVNRVEMDWVIWHIQGILDEQIELKKILEGGL